MSKEFIQIDDGSKYRIAVKILRGTRYYRAEIRRRFFGIPYWTPFWCSKDHGEVTYGFSSWYRFTRWAEESIENYKRLFE